jgi:hypothetical protein
MTFVDGAKQNLTLILTLYNASVEHQLHWQ